MSAITFEEKIDIVENEINKRRGKWQLKAITYMDFDDVKQLIKIHINSKWKQWDQTKPLEPWLNKLISNRITNIIRDNYSSFSRPCLQCSANQGGDLCALYQKQCSECPLYAKWVKRKKTAYDIKMPVSYNDEKNGNIQDHVTSQSEDLIDYDGAMGRINESVKRKLKPEHYEIYKALYIENRDEDDVAEELGYKKNRYNNKNKYKQLENYRRQFVRVVKEVMDEEDLFRKPY